MNDTLAHDTLKVINKILAQQSNSNQSVNLWMWLAILELVIILLLLFKGKFKVKETSRKQFKDESLKQDIDFNNIINSSFNSIALYDDLKVKCHPDRFPIDKQKNAIAETIFKEISKNKTNVKRLLELKEEAKQKLNINF